MQAEQWSRIERIFNAAVVLPENQRASFIDEKSAGDIELKEEVLSLVAETGRDEHFLDDPVFDLGSRLIKQELKTVIVQPEFDSHALQKLLKKIT